MRVLSWADFDAAVERLAAAIAVGPSGAGFRGVYGVPRGGLVLAVALSHRLRLPLLTAAQPGALVVDDVFETGRTLAPFQALEGCRVAVWISKVEPRWWQAAEVTSAPDWLLFPWEDRAKAEADERRYRASRR